MMAMIRTLQRLSDYKTGLDSAMKFSVDAVGFIECQCQNTGILNQNNPLISYQGYIYTTVGSLGESRF